MWVSLKGLSEASSLRSFPYEALNPTTKKQVLINGISDIYKELMIIDNKCKDRAKVGTSLYHYLPYFGDMSHFVDEESQLIIKQYNFCKTFNCPPYPSLQDTPARIIDSFMIIKQEIAEYEKQLTKEHKNG